MSDQHKLLSIDGGGIRGVLALEILANLEKQLADAQGVPLEEFRLSDFFDYVAGTSTGATIAACISRGMATEEIMEFYTVYGPRMFDNRLLRKLRVFLRTGAVYDSGPLETRLQEMFGADTTTRINNSRELLRQQKLVPLMSGLT